MACDSSFRQVGKNFAKDGKMMLYIFAGVAVGWLFRKQIAKAFRPVKLKLNAKFLNDFQSKYNERLRHRKQNLLTQGLKRLQEKHGGRTLDVVEIGAGAGANFEFLPDGVRVTCLEPNKMSEGYLRLNAKKAPGVEIAQFLVGFAEDMAAIPSESADAVICTLVLCSVRNADKCMQEILRVLKPGGQFFFLEHVSVDCDKCTSSLALTRFLQKWLHWLFWYVSDCDVSRRTYVHIERAGFADVRLKHFDAVELISLGKIASVFRPHLIGVATK